MGEKLIYARPGETKVQLVVAEPDGSFKVHLLSPKQALHLAQDLQKEALYMLRDTLK